MNFKLWLEKWGGQWSKTLRPSIEVYGWLSPRGHFYESERFGHIDQIGKHPELKKIIPEFDEFIKAFEELDDPFESPLAAKQKQIYDTYIYNELFKKGCLRVASQGMVLYFDGKPEAIRNLFHKAKDLAEEFGMSAKFEPQVNSDSTK